MAMEEWSAQVNWQDPQARKEALRKACTGLLASVPQDVIVARTDIYRALGGSSHSMPGQTEIQKYSYLMKSRWFKSIPQATDAAEVLRALSTLVQDGHAGFIETGVRLTPLGVSYADPYDRAACAHSNQVSSYAASSSSSFQLNMGAKRMHPDGSTSQSYIGPAGADNASYNPSQGRFQLGAAELNVEGQGATKRIRLEDDPTASAAGDPQFSESNSGAGRAYNHDPGHVHGISRSSGAGGGREATSVAGGGASTGTEELSPEQQVALDLALDGHSFFFTGSAGTGKSFLLRRIISELKAKYASEGKSEAVFVTAPTGIAACNIGGVTIHSFAGVGIDADTKNEEDLVRDLSRKGVCTQRWKSAQVLVIDEVSMLDGNLFDKLEYVARRVRGREGLPFGGIQLVLAGDFFQLPPVGLSNNNSGTGSGYRGGRGGYQGRGGGGYGGGGHGHNSFVGGGGGGDNRPRAPPIFCFKARCWNKVLYAQMSLQKVFRQKDDTFVRILNSLREGKVDAHIERILNSECGREMALLHESGTPFKATKLFSTNKNVDDINSRELGQCLGEGRSYTARTYCEDKIGEPFLKSLVTNCPAPELLELKVGAQVILLKNLDSTRGLVNGARGVVVSFQEHDPDANGGEVVPIVKFSLMIPDPYSVGPATVETFVPRADWTTEMGGRQMASFSQIPLKLAYALTVHKSQGMTIDLLEIDLSSVFECGQAYVALSRAVSLGRMRVVGFNKNKVRAHQDVLMFYDSLRRATSGGNIDLAAGSSDASAASGTSSGGDPPGSGYGPRGASKACDTTSAPVMYGSGGSSAATSHPYGAPIIATSSAQASASVSRTVNGQQQRVVPGRGTVIALRPQLAIVPQPAHSSSTGAGTSSSMQIPAVAALHTVASVSAANGGLPWKSSVPPVPDVLACMDLTGDENEDVVHLVGAVQGSAGGRCAISSSATCAAPLPVPFPRHSHRHYDDHQEL